MQQGHAVFHRWRYLLEPVGREAVDSDSVAHPVPGLGELEVPAAPARGDLREDDGLSDDHQGRFHSNIRKPSGLQRQNCSELQNCFSLPFVAGLLFGDMCSDATFTCNGRRNADVTLSRIILMRRALRHSCGWR